MKTGVQLYVHYKDGIWLPEGDGIRFPQIPIGQAFAFAEVIYQKTNNDENYWSRAFNCIRLSDPHYLCQEVKPGTPWRVDSGAYCSLITLPGSKSELVIE